MDTGFNGSGKVAVDDGLTGVTQGSQVFALADGKALVVASHPTTAITVVTRWNADGTRDDSYGIGGLCQFPGTSPRMLLRPGGAVFVSVHKTTATLGEVRGCTATGAVDTTIGAAEVGPGVVDFARTPDAGFVFLANTTVGAGAPYAGWIRTSSSFVLTTYAQTPLAVATTLVLEADGGFLIGGAEGPELKVVRYTSKDKLDADFGTGGTASFNVGDIYDAKLMKLVAQPDGRVLAIGKHDNGFDATAVRFWP